ncbi:MAG: pilus assembly protein TadG-related protein [Planctomycetota bacterium]
MSRSTCGLHLPDVANRHLRRRGVALIWSAIMMLLMILFVGLSLDTAKVALVMHQLHNAADAAALAGGPWVRRDQLQARLLAQAMAAQNFADKDAASVPQPVLLDLNVDNDPEGDIIVGRYTYDRDTGTSIFTPFDPSATDPIPINALAVLASRDTAVRSGHQATQQVSLNFGPIAGVQSLPVAGRWQGKRGPYAIAMTGGGVGAGLICLRRDLTGLHVHGVSTLSVKNLTGVFEDGGIQVNSFDDEMCVTTNGTPEIIADILNISADGFTQKGDFVFPPEPEMYVNLRQPPLPDPLAWLNYPENKPTTNPDLGVMGTDLGSVRITSAGSIPATPIPAGYYSDGLYLASGTEENPIRLGAGIYILDGDYGLSVGANAVVVCEPGVFFYITGTGKCDIGGGAAFTATPLTSGLYEGIIIAQDPLDLNVASIIGGPGFQLEGTMYFPQHVVNQKLKTDFALILGGTGAVFNNQIIADSVYVPGTSDVLVNYDGRNPAPITRAYLVE